MLELHPLLNPLTYTGGVISDTVSVEPSAASADGGWITLCGPGREAPLQAVVRAVDPHLDVEITGSDDSWTATIIRRDEPAKEFGEVAVTRFSTGATFEFEERRALPLFVV